MLKGIGIGIDQCQCLCWMPFFCYQGGPRWLCDPMPGGVGHISFLPFIYTFQLLFISALLHPCAVYVALTPV